METYPHSNFFRQNILPQQKIKGKFLTHKKPLTKRLDKYDASSAQTFAPLAFPNNSQSKDL